MFYGIEKKYKWYIILRLIIVFSILLSGVITIRRGVEFNFIPLLIIILMSLIGNITFYIILKRYVIKGVDLYVQLLFDNLLVFVIIYYTGGSTSVFNILYFINIIASSFFLFARGGIVLAILSMFNYSTILLGEYYGFLISPYNIDIQSNFILENILMKIYINSFAYIIVGVLSGILSERIQSGKQEILKYRLRLKDIINNIASGIIILNSSFIITDYNKEAKKIFFKLETNKNIFDIDDIFTKNIFKEFYLQFVKDNKFYDLKIEKMYYKNKFENYILIINDITKLKELEKQLIEKERLSVIGELSASIAHEIRNPLSSIKGSIKILQEDLSEELNRHPMFNIVLEEIERLNKLINDFLFYSKKSKIVKQNIILKKMIENIIFFLNIKGNVELKGINNNTIICAEENKLKQVLINLLKNAKESFEKEENAFIKIVFSQSENYDIIKIMDNGKKIDEKIRKNLFKPFNSNKKNGTGLGLAVVYKIIVDEHKGMIDFYEEDDFKIFEIKLLRCEK